ncbi:MAG: hypothetical protein E7549_03745 [Ruminococcaceae bacterium]|nr:hypothetical protein [Oscillospiraceae bacterium]
MRLKFLRAVALTAAITLLFGACRLHDSGITAVANTTYRNIGRLPAPPTTDGVITEDEWGVVDMPLVNYQTFTIPGEAQKVALDGEVYFGYDDTHFYLGIVARYDEHQNDRDGFDLWRGDAVQMQIATDGGKRYAFCFAAGSDGVARGYCSGKETYVAEQTGGEFFVRRDEETKSTVYEIALPLSRFGGETWGEGEAFRFSYAVHMHGGYYYEWCGGIVREKNIDKAGLLVLDGDKAMAAVTTATRQNGDVDVSETVDSTDARMVLQYAVKKIDGAALDLRTADVDGNGAVDSTDARLILQRAVKKIPAFPAGDTQTVVTGEAETDTRQKSSNTFAPTDERAGTPFYSLNDIKQKEAKPGEAEFGYFAFLTRDNEQLPFSVRCYDGGDVISAMVPAGVDLSAMIPSFYFYGDDVLLDGRRLTTDVSVLDLTAPLTLTLVPREGESRTVTLQVETLDTGLPSVAMNIENFEEVVEKEVYLNSTFYIGGGEMEAPMFLSSRTKGRGNSTWGHPKKSYTVKLNTKAEFLGMSESKDWALVANYEDKSLLRNLAAQYLAEGTEQAWVPKRRPVDLWYNGRYWGTYDLAEKIEIEGDRVDITEYEQGMTMGQSGYLLEFDGHVAEVSDERRAGWIRPLGDGYDVFYDPVSDELFMQVPYSHKWLTLKDPDYEDLQDHTLHILYIYQQVKKAVEALQSGDYERIDEMLDVRSFCQWYLVEEFMNNTDSAFHSSCYMTLDAGGKFTMGPIWDFDRSSENCHYWNGEEAIDALYTTTSAWFYMLFAVEECREILQQEYRTFFRERVETLPAHIEEWADKIYASQQYNFMKWDILTTVIGGPRPDEHWNAVALAQKDAQIFEAEVARLNAYFYRTAEKMANFMRTLA